LTVNKASPRGAQPARQPRRNFEPAFSIYVGNLPWDIDGTRLEQVFSEHGKVLSARVVYDRESGRSRGFGFVTMSDESEMNDAVAALDGQVLLKFFVKLSMVTYRIVMGYIHKENSLKLTAFEIASSVCCQRAG